MLVAVRLVTVTTGPGGGMAGEGFGFFEKIKQRECVRYRSQKKRPQRGNDWGRPWVWRAVGETARMDNLPQRLSFHVVHLDAATRCRIAQPAQLYRPYLDGLEDCNFQFECQRHQASFQAWWRCVFQ